MAAHSTLTGADLHEPKGADTASVNTVYMADGAGSGNWVAPDTNINNSNVTELNSYLTDISASAKSCYAVTPLAGVVTKVYLVIANAITTATANISVKINGVAVTGATAAVTVGSSGTGVVYTLTATGANTIAAGQAVEIHTDGGSTVTCQAWVTVVINVS